LALSAPAAPAGAAVVTLTPASGPAGAEVTISGLGLGSRRTVDVVWRGRALAHVRATRAGSARLTLRLPAGRRGTLPLRVGSAGRRRVTVRYAVTTAAIAGETGEVASAHGPRVRYAFTGGRLVTRAAGLAPGVPAVLRAGGRVGRARAGRGGTARLGVDVSGRVRPVLTAGGVRLRLPALGLAELRPPIRAAFFYPWFPELWRSRGYDPFTVWNP